MELYFIMSFPFGIGGVIILMIAIALHRSVIKRRKQAIVRVDATITEVLTGNHSTRNYIYEFSVNGIVRQAQSIGKRYRKKGDVVSIFYNPKYPEMIYVPEAQSWLAIIALYFIGIVWIMGAIMLLIFWKLGIK